MSLQLTVFFATEPASSPNQAPHSYSENRYGKLSTLPPIKAFHISSSIDHSPNEGQTEI